MVLNFVKRRSMIGRPRSERGRKPSSNAGDGEAMGRRGAMFRGRRRMADMVNGSTRVVGR